MAFITSRTRRATRLLALLRTMQRLGDTFIGIEQHEPYFDIACERIRKAYAQPDMFVSTGRVKEIQDGMEF